MRKNYDLIFSFGEACSLSETLRFLKLQNWPYPWIGCLEPIFK